MVLIYQEKSEHQLNGVIHFQFEKHNKWYAGNKQVHQELFSLYHEMSVLSVLNFKNHFIISFVMSVNILSISFVMSV